MSDEFQMDVTVPEGEIEAERNSQDAASKNNKLSVDGGGQRRYSRRLSALNGEAVRSASSLKRRSEFADDDEREKSHLREQNEALLNKISKMEQELDGIKAQRRGELSARERKSIEEVEEENKTLDGTIKKLREKLQAISDVELLDRLQDQLAEKQVQVKTLELKKRTLQEEHRVRSKVLDTLLDKGPKNPQAMFHDMKQETKRHQARIDKNRDRCEKIREAIEANKAKAEEEQRKETELGLQDYDKEEILALQKRDAEQKKEFDLLQRKVAVLGGTMNGRNKQQMWLAKDLAEEVRGLQGQVRHWEHQIQQLETTIMTNQGLHAKPAHFLQPMELNDVEVPSPPKQPRSTYNKTNPHTARPPKTEPTNSNGPTSARPKAKPAPKKKAVPPAKPRSKQKADPAANKKQQQYNVVSGAAFSASSSRSTSRSSRGYSTDSYDRSPSSSPERERKPTPPTQAKEEEVNRPSTEEKHYEEDGQLRNLEDDSYDEKTPSPQRTPTPPKRTPTPPSNEQPPNHTPDAEVEEENGKAEDEEPYADEFDEDEKTKPTEEPPADESSNANAEEPDESTSVNEPSNRNDQPDERRTESAEAAAEKESAENHHGDESKDDQQEEAPEETHDAEETYEEDTYVEEEVTVPQAVHNVRLAVLSASNVFSPEESGCNPYAVIRAGTEEIVRTAPQDNCDPSWTTDHDVDLQSFSADAPPIKIELWNATDDAFLGQVWLTPTKILEDLRNGEHTMSLAPRPDEPNTVLLENAGNLGTVTFLVEGVNVPL